MTTHTFDQGFIQSDRTGCFFTDLEVSARCKAISGHPVQTYRLLISPDKSVRVWNPLENCYTRCHSLSRAAQLRIIRRHIR